MDRGDGGVWVRVFPEEDAIRPSHHERAACERLPALYRLPIWNVPQPVFHSVPQRRMR